MRWFTRRDPQASTERLDWIADDDWTALVASQSFLDRLDDDARRRLRDVCGRFLATKAVNGAGGLVVTADMIGRIATQACLPVLELGADAYPRFDEIVVYPSDFVVDRRMVDEDGVVHDWREAIAGEAWDDGPVVLAWDATARDAKAERPSPFAFNVVIHEFAHKLDMTNGVVDGMPAFSRRWHRELDAGRWLDVLHASFDDFGERLDAVERAIPRHVDPESARADRYFDALPIDAYAATDEGEFFSVSSEAFFVAPERLIEAYPDWYALLRAFYRQDPMTGRVR